MSARPGDLRGRMQGRTCLVTGATDGHGKAMAMALAERGADVVLHGRSREKTLAVRDEVARVTGGVPLTSTRTASIASRRADHSCT